ncbi:hypothetical protein F2P81_005321 [Scophthalmus maximus]|uniref:Uncharacterized protein n=1 Tax=Scophthalmus maximus TaxID=52904 RepID=A0A6A4TA93_SCOMX|nr:hypothetical protein F2P81_005321 [Scophthalmus maximus]
MFLYRVAGSSCSAAGGQAAYLPCNKPRWSHGPPPPVPPYWTRKACRDDRCSFKAPGGRGEEGWGEGEINQLLFLSFINKHRSTGELGGIANQQTPFSGCSDGRLCSLSLNLDNRPLRALRSTDGTEEKDKHPNENSLVQRHIYSGTELDARGWYPDAERKRMSRACLERTSDRVHTVETSAAKNAL